MHVRQSYSLNFPHALFSLLCPQVYSVHLRTEHTFLPCKQVRRYHFSRFHIHMLIYDICFSLGKKTFKSNIKCEVEEHMISSLTISGWLLRWQSVLIGLGHLHLILAKRPRSDGLGHPNHQPLVPISLESMCLQSAVSIMWGPGFCKTSQR